MGLKPNCALLTPLVCYAVHAGGHLKRFFFLLAFIVPSLCGAQTASQRLERLAAERSERVLDLFPVSEIFGRGAGPRQDRVELTQSDEHRERQRAYHRWILRRAGGDPDRRSSRRARSSRTSCWRGARAIRSNGCRMPFHQHIAFIHLDGGVAYGLVQVVASTADPERGGLSRVVQAAAALRPVHR